MSDSPASARPAVIWSLVEESFEEAEFLWNRWEDGLGSHTRDLTGTAFWVEERLAGSLEGIRVGGDAAFEPLLAPAMASDEPWRLAVAAHVAATGDSRQARDLLSIMIGTASGPRLATFRRAVELAPQTEQIGVVERNLARGGLEQKAALLAMRAFRRQAPGPELGEVLAAENPALRAAAFEAARYLGATQGLALVERALGESEWVARNAAVQSGLVLGSLAAWARCLELVRTQAPNVGPLLTLVAQLGTDREHDLLLAALANDSLRRDVLFAAGFAGTVRAADACAEAMRSDEDAPVAAESFCAITGLSLEREHLVEPEPPGPDEENVDANLVPAQDDLLPRPKVADVLSWWKRHRGQFSTAARYARGQPLTMRELQNVLETGPMGRRHATALEMSIRTNGRYDVATRAFTATQRKQMRAFEAVMAAKATPSPLSRSISPI